MRARLAGSRRPSGSATNHALGAGAGALATLDAGMLASGGNEAPPFAGGALERASAAARDAATSARPIPSIVLRAGREPAAAGASLVPSRVPSTTIEAPQCLHVMRARLPRTRSSGTAYFAGQ